MSDSTCPVLIFCPFCLRLVIMEGMIQLCLHSRFWSRLLRLRSRFWLFSFLWFYYWWPYLIYMSVPTFPIFPLYCSVFSCSLAHSRAMTRWFPQERNYSKVSGAWRSSMADIPISVWWCSRLLGIFLRPNFVFIALSYSFACWCVLYLLAQV